MEKKKEMTRRIVMCVVGVLLAGFAVSMFDFSAFGMDPFQVFAHGLWNLTPVSFGTAYVFINGALLVFMLIFNRHMIGLGTLINMFLLGYVVDFFAAIWKSTFPQAGIGTRALFLVLGLVVLCLSSSLYFVADLGVSTYDWIALTISERRHLPFRAVRVTSDLICVAIGFVLHAVIGVGTIVTAFFMGPAIDFFNNTISRPLRYGKEGAAEIRRQEQRGKKSAAREKRKSAESTKSAAQRSTKRKSRRARYQ